MNNESLPNELSDSAKEYLVKKEISNKDIKEKWNKLCESGNLNEGQKKIGEEWIARLLGANFEIGYSDPQNKFFGFKERQALGPTEDLYGNEVSDLVKKLNEEGIEVEIVDLEKINNELAYLSKKNIFGVEKQKQYWESLKYNVVLRSQVEMSEKEKEKIAWNLKNTVN